MKVIFLDVDGVLNSRESDAKCALNGRDLMAPDPKLVIRLLSVCQQTSAEIVLTTSWRLDSTITWPFPVAGVTPRLPKDQHAPRAEEIRAWLGEHLDVRDYVILDDEPDAGIGFGDRFVQTDPRFGLTPEDAARIVGLFT